VLNNGKENAKSSFGVHFVNCNY